MSPTYVQTLKRAKHMLGKPRAQDLSVARLPWVFAIIFVWVALVGARLIWIQVSQRQYYRDRAMRQHFIQINIDPIRGEIRDRNDEVLATSLPSENLYVTPPVFYPDYSRKRSATGGNDIYWGEPDMAFAREYATRVANVLDRPEAFVLDRFLRKSNWFLVERQLSPIKVAALKEVNKDILRDVNKEAQSPSGQNGKNRQARRPQRKEPALAFVPEYRRYYPRNSLACQVLGFVNDSGKGQLGVEMAYEAILAGQTGIINAPKDGLNNYSILKESYIEVPVNGSRLQLTIDSTIQQIVEEVLAETVAASRPITAHCVVVDPNTGEILAMAGTPVFDPNIFIPNKFRGRESELSNAERQELRNWRSIDQAARKVHPLEDSYEPGSTMKIFTAAMALEERKVRFGESIDCMGGQWQYAPNVPPITDSRRYGTLSFEQVLWQSSNVGTAKIGMRVRPADYYKYLKEFGFGDPTLNFAGETRGSVPAPVSWSTPTQYTLSYGYGLSASPLQVLMAGSAIANGGKLMKPQLIKAVYNDKGTLLREFEPEVRFQVISEETSRLMRDVLKGVITNGTAKKAELRGVEAFGKTGTSRKVINGKYDMTRHYASFLGFFPADKPKYGILVMLDEPAGDVTGGDVAAPAFKKIGDAILRYTSTAPQTVLGENLRLTLLDWPISEGDEAAIHVQRGRTPDLMGNSLKTAIQKVTLAGGTIQVRGRNSAGAGALRVTAQSPEPGKPLPQDLAVAVQLRSP
ncbi:MAG: penicillin-binding transpeptidase domain-containing protein [Holophagaceae bacterium]|nr:penicillin-binding transpeptidase domain-containing protein [Holophagaceae bacterium]